MLSLFKLIARGFIKLLPNVLGDRVNREKYQYQAQAAAMHQYAAEFRQFDRTWVDILFDALNRVPRPLILAHVIWSFWYLVLWPYDFGILMAKLAMAPDWYAYIVVGVIGFWFGFRPFEKHFSAKFDRKKFEQGMEVVKEMRKEQSYEEEMNDTSKPLSNQAIMEWNRRRQES